MDASEKKLLKLKQLFAQFECALIDCNQGNRKTGTLVKISDVELSGDIGKNGYSKSVIDMSQYHRNTECITGNVLCHHQRIQETLSDRPGVIVSPMHSTTSTMEDAVADMCHLTKNVHVQHQKIQETGRSIGVTNVQCEVPDGKISPALQSQDYNEQRQKIQETTCWIKADHAQVTSFGQHNGNVDTPAIPEVGKLRPAEEYSNGQCFDQENVGPDTDEFDEEVFKTFVEGSNALDDVKYSFEGQINLSSIIETLSERKNHDNHSSLHSEDATRCTPVSEPLITGGGAMNNLDLSEKRLIGSIDNTKMFVQTSDQKGKKLCCPFCNKLFCKLSRHVEAIHKDKADVQKLASLPKGLEFKKERRAVQEAIKTAGLLKWNTDPSINLDRMLIVPRRPGPGLNRKATDFLICPHCTSFHSIKSLRNHFTTCTDGALKGTRNIKILARSIEGRSSKDASEQLRKIIPVMKEDDIVRLIRYDWLLIAYGNILCMKYNFHFQHNMIRAKLRLAGRVLHALKNIDSEATDFASIFLPKRYKVLIEAIKVVGKFNPVTNEFGTPATAASAITSMKQIGSILKCEYIQKEDSEHVKRTDDFLYLMDSQFSAIIRKRVRESQLQKRREKDHKLPSKDDVRLFSTFVKSERNICWEKLSTDFDYTLWVKLSQLTIASIIVFNRRRTGESQNILVSDFQRRESINETSNEDLFAALSEKAKKVARLYSRMKIRGKKGVLNVNVLLQADIVRCIELLLIHRVRAGIPVDNPFLFALPSPPGEDRIRVVNACKVLASLSTMCGAEDPTTLRGTNLRKHFATACMAKGLPDELVGEVAKHLGHRESVHRENYRINTIDREVVKIVKLLHEAEGTKENDDDNESDSDESDDELDDHVTILKSSIYTGPNKRKNCDKVNNVPNRKRKKKTVGSSTKDSSFKPSDRSIRKRKGPKENRAVKKIGKQNALETAKQIRKGPIKNTKNGKKSTAPFAQVSVVERVTKSNAGRKRSAKK